MAQQQQYQQQQQQADIGRRNYPGTFDIFLHGIKTFKLIGALLTDRRVSFFRKALFLGVIALLLALLFFPDIFNEFFLSTVLPVIGTVLGIPIDAGIDWVAFAFVVVSLLRIFPVEVMAEHYRQIYG